jgi:hypothetical protein
MPTPWPKQFPKDTPPMESSHTYPATKAPQVVMTPKQPPYGDANAMAELDRLRARVAELEKSEARWREKYMALHLRACMVMRLDSFDSIIRNSLSDDDEQWTDFERAAFKATNAAFSAIEAAVYWKAVAEGEADISARVAQLEGENARYRAGLIAVRDEIPAAKSYATSEGCSPGDGKSAAFTSAVHIKLDMILGYAVEALGGSDDGRS